MNRRANHGLLAALDEGEMSTIVENRRKLKSILGRLERAYGRRKWKSSGDPLSVLVGTILSQNTNGANSSAGFRKLRDKFATWEQAADAPVRAIRGCIRVSGLSRIKAPRIRSILRRIRTEHGAVSLEFLRSCDPQDAFDYLMKFDGVGPKTAWCVLLFSFGMKVFPVDTHIHRIAGRLGLLGELGMRTSAEKAHEVLAPLIAPDKRYATHVLLIAHGRRTCLARRPRCNQCCILQFCTHAQAELGIDEGQ